MRDKILIVDDAEINRKMLANIVSQSYEVIEADDGDQAIEILEAGENMIVTILLDLRMPRVDGYAVLEYMRTKGLLEKIAVLVVSADGSREVELNCLERGVSDFIRKPFDRVAVMKRVKNITDLFLYKNHLEEQIAAQTEALQEKNYLLEKQKQRLETSNEKIIDVLGTVVEYRNLEGSHHISNVKRFTKIIAEKVAENYPEYELTQNKIEVITAASALHDIGKIAIRDSVLLKPARLTAEEFEYMKSHSTRGCDILNRMEGVWDENYAKACYEICRYHHERFDGTGYPDGLAGDEIPISAQIVAVADVYDALVSERVYKAAIQPEKAFNMILMGECGVISPKILDCFRKCRHEFEKVVC